MNAAQIHLAVVHVAVVGCLAAFVLLVAALSLAADLLFRTACWFQLACAVFATAAYYSGPPTYELLERQQLVAKSDVEQHALVGRAAFVGMIVLGIVALNALLPYFQGQKPPQWLKWTLLVGTLAMCYVFAWTAHLGGLIRHPELREPAMLIFPRLG